MNVCLSCHNVFVQPFVCTTCGAERLYDETVRSQAAEIERLADLWRRAVVGMNDCDCEWEPDPNNPDWHTDKIRVLCGAHEELFEQRTEQLRAENRIMRRLLAEGPNADEPIDQRLRDEALADAQRPNNLADKRATQSSHRDSCALKHGGQQCSCGLTDAQHPEQQPDIDAFLGEGRKPVRSLASVMVPSARDQEQQPDSDARDEVAK